MRFFLPALLLALTANSLAADINIGSDKTTENRIASSPAADNSAINNTASSSIATNNDATSTEPPYAGKLRSDAEAVLKGPDFHEMSSGTVPVARPWLQKWFKPDTKKKEKPPVLPNFPLLAQALKIIVVVVAALLLGWLLWRGWQWLSPQLAGRQALRRHGKVRDAQSLPLQDEATLPDSISSSAALAWQAGQQVQALSLLYRGAVAALASHHQLSLPDGATEGDYLRLLRRSGKRELANSFTLITQAWMSQAYAQRSPADFPSLLQSYRQHFEMAGSRS